MGQALVKRYNVYLRDLILAGIAEPSLIASHRLPLAGAPNAYKALRCTCQRLHQGIDAERASHVDSKAAT